MTTTEQLLTPLRRESDPTRFVGALRDAAEAVHDRIMPLSSLRLDDTATVVSLTDPSGEAMLLPSGVASTIVTTPTRTAWRHMAERLAIPLPYLDRLGQKHPDLAATNVNVLASRDERNVMFRLWLASDGALLRAVMSDRFRIMDNYAALGAITAGMSQADISLGDCEVDVDLTPDRFRMRIAVPQISALVPDLLTGYRWPFSHQSPDVHAPNQGNEVPPVLWAGLEISNSETGGGAYSITPRAVVLVCRNGLTRPVDMLRNVHVGSRLDEGVIEWADETRRLEAELLSSQVKDAVTSFCSVDYLQRMVDEMRAAKGLAVVSPTAAIARVVEQHEFTETEHRNILDAFMRGGDTSALGIGQAVTAAAQLVESGDRQSEMEGAFWSIVADAPRLSLVV